MIINDHSREQAKRMRAFAADVRQAAANIPASFNDGGLHMADVMEALEPVQHLHKQAVREAAFHAGGSFVPQPSDPVAARAFGSAAAGLGRATARLSFAYDLTGHLHEAYARDAMVASCVRDQALAVVDNAFASARTDLCDTAAALRHDADVLHGLQPPSPPELFDLVEVEFAELEPTAEPWPGPTHLPKDSMAPASRSNVLALFAMANEFHVQRGKLAVAGDRERAPDLVSISRQISDLGELVTNLGDEVLFRVAADGRTLSADQQQAASAFAAATAPAGRAISALGEVHEQLVFRDRFGYMADSPDYRDAARAANAVIADQLAEARLALSETADGLRAASKNLSEPSVRVQAARSRSTVTSVAVGCGTAGQAVSAAGTSPNPARRGR